MLGNLDSVKENCVKKKAVNEGFLIPARSDRRKTIQPY